MTYPDTSGLPPRDPAHHPRRLLEAARAAGRPLFVQAPMVRYSKLPFRALVRNYGVDLCYTPMLLAKEFVRSERARCSDFATIPADRSLIVQFASSNPTDFARAAQMVQPFCDGVNLNCGCPQSWAIHDGVGCAMMRNPELVRDMVVAAKQRCGEGFCVSVKIRVHKDLDETKRFVKIVEEASVDYITVHGRTRATRSSTPVDLAAIRSIKEVAMVPVVANGDCFTLDDACRIVKETGADGVMAARGLMVNPALFTGVGRTPWGAIERFLAYAVKYWVPYKLVLHHVAEMMEGMKGPVGKRERAEMVGGCADWVGLIDWLDERFVLRRPGEVGFGQASELERRERIESEDLAS